MAVEVVGRDGELGSVGAFVDRGAVAEDPSAFVLEGEAGIGKSTLWLAAVEVARERGFRVLSSRPAEPERGLAHAGLGDLFDGVLEDVLPALTAPQRRALEVALLVHDRGERPIDPRAVGVAVRSSLELLAADEVVVVAIDDVQWLDASSANALAFALRRLPAANILLLLARRLGEGSQASVVENAVAYDRTERLGVPPLSVGAIHQLLHGRLDRTFARPTLLRLHEVSGGNPFYALELARATAARGPVDDPTQPLPVPVVLEEVVRARLDGFTGATREALALAAAHGRLSPAQLNIAGIEQGALDPAVEEQVVELTAGVVRFTHPLLASVLYQGLPPGERQRVHGLLATVVDDPLGRARHLALSTEQPNSEIAATLEQAAAAATDQGAPIAAAELGEHARRLTPAEAREDHVRRTMSTARAHFAAGDAEQGRMLARELVASARAGAERSGALVLMAEETEEPQESIELLREALREAAAHPALQASIHQLLSLEVRFTEGLVAAEVHARASIELAEQLGDDALRAVALSRLAVTRCNTGKADAVGIAEQAYDLATAANHQHASPDPGLSLAHVLVWSLDLERARSLLESLHREWSERDERVVVDVLWHLALVELRAGRLSLAAEYADQGRELFAQYHGDALEAPESLFAFFPIALVAAHRGDLDRAREVAERNWRLADDRGMLLGGLGATLGIVDQWSGDPVAAVARFAAAEQTAAAAHWVEPSLCWWRSDYVEALLQLGQIDDAVGVLDPWEADARRLGREWVLAEATRCRALVAAASGDVEEAQVLLTEAIASHERVGDPFGRARALLALGVVRRQARRKGAAREAIEAALSAFDELGAAGWAEKARAELGRIGGRTRTDGLTPAERRVAELVATGQTNTEVAAALFLAERTVASHLTHIYAKLGVRSRTELARRLQ